MMLAPTSRAGVLILYLQQQRRAPHGGLGAIALWRAPRKGGTLLAIALSDTVSSGRRVFKTKTFDRWLRKTTLADRHLCDAVAQMSAGLIDADLGGRVFKKRVAAPGRGKSGGARVVVATNLDNRWFFVYGFEKNERANIDDRELATFRRLADVLLNLDVGRLLAEQECGNLTEICNEKAKSYSH
jgi:hypothetical protein